MRFDNVKVKIQDKEDLETLTSRDAELSLYQTMYLPGFSSWLMFALDVIVESLARNNTTTSSNPSDSSNKVVWVQCPVLVDSFLEVLLCPVFFMIDICLDHALLKRLDITRLKLN
jgi:hypothetical protein